MKGASGAVVLRCWLVGYSFPEQQSSATKSGVFLIFTVFLGRRFLFSLPAPYPAPFGSHYFLPSFRVSSCAFASKTFARRKKTPAPTTCISATSLKIWTFSAFLYISETTRTNFFKISPLYLHNVNNNVWNFHRDWFTATPWNFKTNLSYEPVKHLPYNIHRFDVMLIFPK